jgi:3-oxo-5-alpha-steroid 4-dehydrogenase 3
MDSSLLCKLFFGLGTAVDIGGTLFPSFRSNIMNYGSRSTTPTKAESKASNGPIQRLFQYVGSFRVPHTWFTHYYVVSVLSSLFWGVQIYANGSVIKLLASYSQSRTSSMTFNQVLLAWGLMAAQGIRRLYESITLMKPSQSKMWVGIWALGIAYYTFMGISVWIEGLGL